MKWFDNWIEKMYLKKHPVKEEKITSIEEPTINPTKPNECIISVKRLEPTEIQSVVSFSQYNLEDLDREIIYEQLVKTMLPDLEKHIEIKYIIDPLRGDISIYGKLLAYSADKPRYDWYQKLLVECRLRSKSSPTDCNSGIW